MADTDDNVAAFSAIDPGSVLTQENAQRRIHVLVSMLPPKVRREYQKEKTFNSLFTFWKTRLDDRPVVALVLGEFKNFANMIRSGKTEGAPSQADLISIARLYLPPDSLLLPNVVILKAYQVLFWCASQVFPEENDLINAMWDFIANERIVKGAEVPDVDVLPDIEDDFQPVVPLESEFGQIGGDDRMEGIVEDPDLEDLAAELEERERDEPRAGIVATTIRKKGGVAAAAKAIHDAGARAGRIAAARALAAAPINIADAVPDRGLADVPRAGAADLPRRSLAEQITRLPPRGDNRYRNSDKFRVELVNTRDEPGCFAKSPATTYDPKMGIIRAKYRPGPKPGSAAAAGSSRRITMINRLRRGEEVSLEEAMAAGLKQATAERLIARGAQPRRVPPRGARPGRTQEQRDAEATTISRAAAGYAAGLQIRSDGRLGNDPFQLAARLIRAPATDSNTAAVAYVLRKEAAARARKAARQAKAEAAARYARSIGKQAGAVMRRPTTASRASSLLNNLSNGVAKKKKKGKKPKRSSLSPQTFDDGGFGSMNPEG